MDVSQKIDAQTKTKLNHLYLECQVLRTLLREREDASQEALKLVMVNLGAAPSRYGLKVDFAKDSWNLELRPEALIIPNRSERRAEIRKN